MPKQLDAYTILQKNTTTDLGFMPEFVEVATKCLDAYKEYYEHSTALECIKAFYELGVLAERHGVFFDLVSLQFDLYNLAEGEHWA
jgi:hypothetical protein